MNTAIVSSRGGHLGQIKIIFTKEIIGKNKAILITESDKETEIKERGFLNKYGVYLFKKDYLGFHPVRYLTAIRKMIMIFKKEKTELVITNGAQISIPAVIAGKILGIQTLFIDTVIRVKTPNWSARACYLFSDVFLVQHKEMVGKYGRKAKFIGGIL